MTRFQVITEKHNGTTVYVLRDLQCGSVARVVPSKGGNCLELALCPAEGMKPVAVINDLQFIDKLAQQSSRYGIPVLFPWPSGIPKGIFEFEGKRVELNPPGVTAATHHGFVNTASWRVVRSDCDNTGAWVTCAIASGDCGDKATRFPFSFELELTWKLTADGLKIAAEARNTGKGPMPMGLGFHPYFTIPFGSKGSRGECRLAVDAVRQWDLKAIVDVEPGEKVDGSGFLAAMEFDATAPGGKPIEDVKFNHVYQAGFEKKSTHASVTDPANGLTLTVTGSEDFGTWVIYTPPDRSAISLEPWTLVPNGFNLAAAGRQDSGIKVIKPGANWTGEIVISAKM